jgi:uncharacterized protein YjbI with pentapeptide repeats
LAIDRVNAMNLVDLSHEAMMKGWKQFVKWRESNRDERRLGAKIEEARREWHTQKQQGKYLLEGRLLGDAKRLLKDRSEILLEEVQSFVKKSLQYQRWRRLQSAGWLILPVLVLGIPSEYFWRKEVLKQDYFRIENSKSAWEKSLSILNLTSGCWANENESFNNVPDYIRERFFGNCQTLSGVNLKSAVLENGKLSGANLHNANLDGASLGYADLTNADLTNANLRHADLTNANLTNTNLTGADLTNAKLDHANLEGAKLSGVVLRGAKLWIDIQAVNLKDVDLSGADLNNAKLRNANLQYVDLSGANLSFADFSNASFRDVDFSDADLSGVNLNGANFSFVDFSNAKLDDANLSGSEFISFSIAGFHGAPMTFVKECSAQSQCNNMQNVRWSKNTNWKGAKGLNNIKNMPLGLKNQLKSH